jgi:hypothetical protein
MVVEASGLTHREVGRFPFRHLPFLARERGPDERSMHPVVLLRPFVLGPGILVPGPGILADRTLSAVRARLQRIGGRGATRFVSPFNRVLNARFVFEWRVRGGGRRPRTDETLRDIG